MQKAISLLLNGETLPALFITILQYVLPSQDHTVQKLLLLYLVRSCLGVKFANISAAWLSISWLCSAFVLVSIESPRIEL